jgi:long-chain fatty acid transport protein
MKKYLLASSLLLASSVASFGGGFQLNLQGLRQLAMGGSGTAWPWDASTIFYNPGGLARLKNIQVYGSVMAIMPATAYGNIRTQSSQSAVPQTFTPFSIYVGGPLQRDSKFALGLGIYTPFGSGVKWDDNWIGKYIIQSIDLQCVFFQPTISYRASELLSIGGGFIYAAGAIDLRKAMPVHSVNGPYDPNRDEGQAHLHSAANGVGFNLGLQFKLSESLQLGLTYRSQVNMNVSGGSANFTVPSALRDSFPNTTFDAQLPLPQVVSVGVGWRPIEALTLQFDLNYTGWSAYDTLRINFTKTTSSLENMRAPRQYKNVISPRIGATYKISRVVAVMGGFAYDPTPIKDGFVSPDLPDANRVIATCGLTIKPIPRFTIIAAFEAATSVKRTASYDHEGFSGTYKTSAAVPGIAFYYTF